MSLVPCPFVGWVCPEGVFMSGVGGHPPEGGTAGGVGSHPSPRHGIQQDMVGKWVICILLECFLVHHITTS